MPNNQIKSEKVERFESFLRTHRVFTEYKRMVNKRDCTCYEQFLKNEDEKRFICSAFNWTSSKYDWIRWNDLDEAWKVRINKNLF